jgi:DNA-binding transcriptional ArsR family regulator
MDDRQTDRVFKALADKTRRKMLDLLAQRPHTTGEIAANFPGLSRFAVMKHLNVLVKARLVLITRDGRKRWNRINAVTLRDIVRRWVSRYEALWSDVLLNIKTAAESPADADRSALENNQDHPPS